MMNFKYTTLYADDVQLSLAFYQAAFGFEIGFVHEAGDYGELVTGDTKLVFASRALLKSLGKNPSKPDKVSPIFNIGFETNEVDLAFDQAIKAGAIEISKPTTMEWGQRVAYVNDIDGYLVEICAPIGG